MQSILHRNHKLMLKHGVHYVHHRDMRKKLTVPAQQNGYMHAGVHRNTVVTDDMLHTAAKNFFTPIIDGNPERLILSDENLAGHCGHCVRFGQLYRFRDPFMKSLSGVIPFPVREVHLAVRNYADFFAAAYVEYIRALQKNSTDVTFTNEMTKRVFKRLPAWYGVINRIKAYFPDAKIYIWTFEEFRENPALGGHIIDNIVGPLVDTSKFKLPKNKNQRPSASGIAIQKIQDLILERGIPVAVEQIREIQDQFPRSSQNPGFDPWNKWERQHLLNLYETDIRRIALDPEVSIVSMTNR